MIRKIEHIGIAVKSTEEVRMVFEKLLGYSAYKQERVDSENVLTTFFKLGDSKLELLEATSPDSAIAKYLERFPQGVHHIALEVDDIVSELARLESLGFQLIHKAPKLGADNKWIAFLHPKSTAGVLVELCQENNSQS
ncbi:MAG: methylmalonyl-CoA epimerase [Flavobacteriales bacterium]